MKLKKLSLVLLAALSISQMPPVWGMEQGDQQQEEQIDEQVQQFVDNNGQLRFSWQQRDRNHLDRLLLYKRVAAAGIVGFNALGGGWFLADFLRGRNDNVGILSAVGGAVGLGYAGFVIGRYFNTNDNLSYDLQPLVRNITNSTQHALNKISINPSDIDRRGHENDTLLMRCSKNSDCAGVKKCLALGTDVNLVDMHDKNALKYAIDSGSEEVVRTLLLARANREVATAYLTDEVGRCEQEIAVLQGILPERDQHILSIKRAGLVKLRQIQQLFSQTPAQLLAPLTQAQRADYTNMFIVREAVKPSLHGSLMLYEHFNEDTELKKYLSAHKGVYQGLAAKRNGMPGVMPNVMSFLRKKPEETERRLDNALGKAVRQRNVELVTLLKQNGAEENLAQKVVGGVPMPEKVMGVRVS